MSVEENKAHVRDEFRRWELEGDETLIDELYSADCVWHGPGGLEVTGREGMKQWMAALGAAFPDKRYELHDIIAEGDKVVVRFTFRATHKGEWQGVAPTNKQVASAASTSSASPTAAASNGGSIPTSSV